MNLFDADLGTVRGCSLDFGNHPYSGQKFECEISLWIVLVILGSWEILLLGYTFDRQLSTIDHLSPQYPCGSSLGSDRVYFAPGLGSNGHSLSVLAVKRGKGWNPEEIDFIRGKVSAPLHYSLQDWVQTPEVMIDNPHADWKLVKFLTLQRFSIFLPESYFNWRLSGLHSLAQTSIRHHKLWSTLSCSSTNRISNIKKNIKTNGKIIFIYNYFTPHRIHTVIYCCLLEQSLFYQNYYILF